MRPWLWTIATLAAGCGGDPDAAPDAVTPRDTIAPGMVGAISCPTRSAALSESPLVRWTAAVDEGGSGIDHYEVSIGTAPGAHDIADWTAIGNVTEYTWTGLALATRTKHFISVRAVDGAGNVGAVREGPAWKASHDGAIDIGAIRFDPWHGGTALGMWADSVLSPLQWHYRLPFFASVLGDNQVELRNNTQAVIDREIEYARAGGIDYWAYLFYQEANNELSQAMQLHLASSHKHDIKLALIIWDNLTSASIDTLVGHFKDPDYERVAGGRPLLYLLDPAGMRSKYGTAAVQTMISNLKAATIAAGLPPPYLAAQVWDAASGADNVVTLGLDAINSYALTPSSAGAPYSDLASADASFWAAAKQTGHDVIPIVNAGWDPRPRIDDPPPWGNSGTLWAQTATAAEVAYVVSAATVFVDLNTAATPARSILIYAWNEYDEGGWLAPTLSDGSARLDAIRAALPH